MGKKIISGSLSVSSIREMRKQVIEYKTEFERKNEVFVRRLCELGIPVINENINAAKGDSEKRHNTFIKINSFGSYSQATLVCEGKDILFIEFGAGVHYNGPAGSSPNPKGKEFGYRIGSYGKGFGKNDSWYYTAGTGESVKSYGTQATMPVYKASLEIIQNIRKIAREVFG